MNRNAKRVLLINGHPDRESFNYALAEAYRQGISQTGAAFSQINLADLHFSPNLQYGYRQRTEWEPDLEAAMSQIQQADHLVWVFPMWWYGYPALMKGFIDRTFLPGVTFQPVPGKALPRKLLTGKSARLIITADTPRWYDYWWMHSPAINQFNKGTLAFCGVRPVWVTYLAPIKGASQAQREKWLHTVQKLGQRAQ